MRLKLKRRPFHLFLLFFSLGFGTCEPKYPWVPVGDADGQGDSTANGGSAYSMAGVSTEASGGESAGISLFFWKVGNNRSGEISIDLANAQVRSATNPAQSCGPSTLLRRKSDGDWVWQEMAGGPLVLDPGETASLRMKFDCISFADIVVRVPVVVPGETLWFVYRFRSF